jgi:hypothetical protein
MCYVLSNLLLEFPLSQLDLWTTQYIAPPVATFSCNIGWKALILSSPNLFMQRFSLVRTILRMGLTDAVPVPFKFSVQVP